ncbi:hypothetical protein SK128_006937 [Halocaridina rubra]|uniref:Rho-GAP domain-containing protein n=1 Tax=Halocaridina rubra TaxID=373956 RepID=A0AAN8WNE5_HALRR
MEEDKEELKELILDELKRLGMQEAVSKKKNGAAQGARFLGINTASNSNGVASKNKVKNKRSPRISRSRSPRSKLNSNRARDERKYTPKSPFSSSKRKAELRKQNTKGLPSCQIFGQKLESIPCVCVYMTDGTQVTVPELLVDLCNLIRRNINIEGIFRKAGSSQRQNDLKV